MATSFATGTAPVTDDDGTIAACLRDAEMTALLPALAPASDYHEAVAGGLGCLYSLTGTWPAGASASGSAPEGPPCRRADQ